jgi:hypothetical protein
MRTSEPIHEVEPTSAGDRSTAFQAMTNEPEHYSGTVLLVTAYALVWVILLGWLAMMWRKQSKLVGRINEIEHAIE